MFEEKKRDAHAKLSCCYANLYLSFFTILVVVAVVLANKALYCCDPELLPPCQHFSSLYKLLGDI